MSTQPQENDQNNNEKNKPYITITKGMSGWFAVKMWWNPEMGGFWEPDSTGYGRYEFKQSAIQEAKEWAVNEGLEYQ